MRNKIIAVCVFALINTACTKKDSTVATPDKENQSANVTKPANSNDCFKLKVGQHFTLNDRENSDMQIADATLNEQKAIAIARQAVGTHTDNIYDLTGRTQLASLTYGVEALGTDPNTVVMSTHYEAPLPTYPENLKPNQTFKLTYKSKSTSSDGEETSGGNLVFDVTFKGFEDLNFVDANNQKLSLKNVCHFESKLAKESKDEPLINGLTNEWIAEGYGVVKTVQKTKDGELFSSEAIGEEAQP